MHCPPTILPNGTPIRTHRTLDAANGLPVHRDSLKARRSDAPGKIAGVVGGYGGDVYWVHHENGIDVAVYSFAEFELDTPPTTTAYDLIG